MPRPTNLKTKIFLDSGNPIDTANALEILGFLDGQTTNPTLISKNPDALEKLTKGEKYSEAEVYEFYKSVVNEISGIIPEGSVSIEVYADKNTTAEHMYIQALEMYSWIPNAQIKFPTNSAGLEAASRFVNEKNGRVNMTLCFNQEQGAAVYSATLGAKKGQVYYSSFVGRLIDIGVDGIAQLANCQKMYQLGDNHVEILACSFRTLDQFLDCLQLGVDIATVPLSIIKQWAEGDFYIPQGEFTTNSETSVKPVYKELDLSLPWDSFDIQNELTTAGIDKFAQDWNNLVK
jgi:transaldolase